MSTLVRAAIRIVSDSAITRPNDTNAYADGDLLANNTTASSVTPFSLAISIENDEPCVLHSGKIVTTDTGAPGASIELWLFRTAVVAASHITNGDNGAFSISENDLQAILTGTFESTKTGSVARLVPKTGLPALIAPVSGGKTLNGLLKVKTAFTPIAQSTWTPTLYLEPAIRHGY